MNCFIILNSNGVQTTRPLNIDNVNSDIYKYVYIKYNFDFDLRSENTAIPVSQDGQRNILANGTLLLRSVKAEDSGYYTCTATNTLGFDTIIVNLLVQGKVQNIYVYRRWTIIKDYNI